MRYLARFLLLLLFFPLMAHAQTTSVSGTITDAGGQAWKYGTYSFSFVVASNNPQGPYKFQGATFNTNQVISGNLDSTGSFAGAVVPDNAFISPGGTRWKVSVCPGGTTACYQNTLTITGSTQNISSAVAPPAIILDLSNPPSGASTYSDSEVTGARPGQFYYNINANTIHLCEITPFPPCTWIGFASGTVSSFSSGNLSPLFTSSVSNPTTTPALSFSLSNAAANTVFGNCGVTLAAPSYCTITAAMLPGGTGTVSSFSAGTANPFFTTSVSNPTTTPALSFAVVAQAAHCFLAGPTSGGSAAPTCRAIVGTDLPNPSLTTLGGVEAINAVAGEFVDSISTAGVPHLSAVSPAASLLVFSDTPQSGNVTVSASTTTIVSHAITMPSAGCPCRVQYSFSISADFTSFTNVSNVDAWVTDGTNNFRGVETGQSNAAGGAQTSLTYTGWTTVTYSNSQSVTFTLDAITASGGGFTARATPQSGLGATAGMSLAVFSSN